MDIFRAFRAENEDFTYKSVLYRAYREKSYAKTTDFALFALNSKLTKEDFYER